MRQEASIEHMGRLEALDGLRCVAIIPVVLFHYLYFWTPAGAGLNIVAYEDKLSAFPFAAIGFLGVHLFFVISGFVILLTLERSASFIEFVVRRAIRLWPPIILFGTVTFIVVHLFGPEELAVGPFEYVLSLFFLPPQHAAKLFGASGWQWLDGAYWSLWVEIRFYVIVGALYFLNRTQFLKRWMMFEAITIAVGLASMATGSKSIDMLDGLLFQEFVPYFSLGLASYMAFTDRRSRDVELVAALGLLHLGMSMAVTIGRIDSPDVMFLLQYFAGQAAILYLFYRLSWRRQSIKWLEHPYMVSIGQSSYGTYLLHQNVGVTILSAPIFSNVLTGAIGVALTMLLIVAVSWMSYSKFERPVQRYLRQAAQGFTCSTNTPRNK